MKFLSAEASARWRTQQGLDGAHECLRASVNEHLLRFQVPADFNRLTWFCRVLEGALRPRDQCLLWITGWGVWASSENWHLYYRVRQSYGDLGLLEDVPGHLFLSYEGADLISFLQMGILFGWDMQILPSQGYGYATVSHEGDVGLVLTDPGTLTSIRDELVGDGVNVMGATS